MGDNVNSKKERNDAKLRSVFFLVVRPLLDPKNRRTPRGASSKEAYDVLLYDVVFELKCQLIYIWLINLTMQVMKYLYI